MQSNKTETGLYSDFMDFNYFLARINKWEPFLFSFTDWKLMGNFKWQMGKSALHPQVYKSDLKILHLERKKKQTEGREKPFEGEHRGRRRSGNSWFQLCILTGVFISVGVSFFLSHYMSPCYNETSIKKKL